MLFRNQDQHNSSIFGDSLERVAADLDAKEMVEKVTPKVSLNPSDFIGNKNSVIPSTSLDSVEAKTSSNHIGTDRSALMFDKDLYDSLSEDSREKTARLREEELSSKKEAQDSFELLSKPSESIESDLIQKSSSSLKATSETEDKSGLIPGYENSIFDNGAFERLDIHEPELKKNVNKEANNSSEVSKQTTSDDILDSMFSKLDSQRSNRSTFNEKSIDSLYDLIKNKG
jgi:hypothetical protein|tara:strand:- start:1003 stop:1689 length:687 start_codon:yes stop_codon:yes gene_type:complete